MIIGWGSSFCNFKAMSVPVWLMAGLVFNNWSMINACWKYTEDISCVPEMKITLLAKANSWTINK
jgi:hypothetical protein